MTNRDTGVRSEENGEIRTELTHDVDMTWRKSRCLPCTGKGGNLETWSEKETGLVWRSRGDRVG